MHCKGYNSASIATYMGLKTKNFKHLKLKILYLVNYQHLYSQLESGISILKIKWSFVY